MNNTEHINSLPLSTIEGKQNRNKERYFQWSGLIAIAVGFVGFLLWAAFAPLDKGITAPGTVMVAGKRKAIQSPGNGIIEKVWVKEGDNVEAGATLIELSRTQIQARYDQYRDKYLTALATHARLQAEQSGSGQPQFPALLFNEAWRAQGEAIIALQQTLLQARREALNSEINASQHALNGLRYQTESLQNALVLKRKLNQSLQQQLIDMRALAEENYLPRNRYRELERQQHETGSQIAELSGQININREKIKETEQYINKTQSEYRKDVSNQLAKTATEIDELQKNMAIARYDLDNTRIVSSTSGTVMALNTLMPGSVLSAGETLMEIVPQQAPLIIESQVGPELIDKVYPGLAVNMMFIALNQNKTPVIPGYIKLVAPDRLVNKNSGDAYYQIQITVSEEGRQLLKNADIRPGMPVSVLVKTGSRSLLSYLFKPVLDRAQTALTEE
ncbi:MAG: HlyD family type I secretion periplasmic adaptor subunit [Pantoea sp.]|nr:HlyD family type I secretion periplasmic adaptor subunit [Pantoea sp.]